MTTPPTPRRTRWRRAGFVLALLGLGVVIGGRLLLPTLVRRVVLDRAQALNARIDVGATELSLWWGGLVLHDVAVRSATPPRRGPDTPLIACKRLVLGWRWRPLLQRTVRLRKVEIEEPRIVLDRLADGDFNLAALLPRPRAPGPHSAQPPEWAVAIDRLVVSNAGVRFRDLAVDDSGPMDASLDRVEVARIAFSPGLFGKPTRLHLDLAIEDGRVDVVARLAEDPHGVTIGARVRAQRLPLARTRLYAPELGWSDLGGRLSATLRYAYAPTGAHTLTGGVTLDDVSVHVPKLDGPALTAKRITGTLAPVDFRHQRIALDRVALRGGMLVVDPRGPLRVPLVSGPGEAKKGATPSPWSVAIKSLAIDDSQIMVPARPPMPATTVDVELTSHDAVVTGTTRVPLRATLRAQDASVGFVGQTALDRFDLTGDLSLQQVSLPAVIDAFGWLPPNVLQTGRADGTLEITAGGKSGDIELNGPATIDELWIAADDPHEFSVGAKRVAGTLGPLRIPGAATAATTVRFRDLQLDEPYAEVTRTPTGWLGPRPSGAEGHDDAAPLAITIDAARAGGARVYLADRTVTPYFVGGLDPFDGSLQHFQWPAATVEYFQIDGHPPERGRLSGRGWLVPGGNQLDVDATDVALPPLNPYVVTFTSYSVPRGRLSGTGTAWFGPWGWDARSHLLLHDFDLAGGAGDALFRERFGVSLGVGLAALRDGQGNIELDVPLSVDREGARVGVSTVMAGALERALLNLLATPGKLMGALFSSKGDPTEVLPGPIPFAVGRDQPLATGDDGIKSLAAFLAARPGVAVTLLGDITKPDVRWLAESSLREQLTAGARLEPPADRAAAQRILSALRARSEGEAGTLSVPDGALVDRWVDSISIPAEMRQALATARLEHVRTTLEQRFGLGTRRVAVRPPRPDIDDGVPAVLLQFGPVGALRQQ